MRLPSGENATDSTVSQCASKVRRSLLLAASHSLSVLSLPPEAIRPWLLPACARGDLVFLGTSLWHSVEVLVVGRDLQQRAKVGLEPPDGTTGGLRYFSPCCVPK